MLSKSLSFISISVLLYGCATPATGPLYADYKSQQRLSPEQSKVTVFRQHFDSTAKARSARIKVDGNKSGGVDIDGFISFDIQPGQHTLSADLPEQPGSCELPVELVAGNEYFYEVTIRDDAIGPTLLLGLLGASLESAGKKCGGLFAIHAVEKTYAEPILKASRLTK